MERIIPTKPVDAIWTEPQWRAIYETGEDILVGAAAGSGKTAVLIERIIQKIINPTHPIEIDKILVVTFTDAAAREMRNRLSVAIEKELIQNPNSAHLRRQIGLLSSGNISTIHAFCLKVIGEYHYKIDMDPAFRIGDSTEMELLKDEVLEELLEKQYAKENNEAFFQLVDAYTSDRNDVSLKEMIETMYRFAITNPHPDQYLEQILAGYQVNAKSRLSGYIPTVYVLAAISRYSDQAVQALQAAMRFCDVPGGPDVYIPHFVKQRQMFADLSEAVQRGNWSKVEQAFAAITFERLPAASKKKYDETMISQAKKFYGIVKDKVYKNLCRFFTKKESEHLVDIRRLYPMVKELVRLTRLFMVAFQEEKRKGGLVDFHDIEHFCLQILLEWDEKTKSFSPSEVGSYYAQFFEEVFVDEYQDTNRVQEAIVQAVSRSKESGGNLFMVGDVKQSIYRFRLAEPDLFLEKYASFSYEKKGSGLKIDLSQNFRSRKEVLGITNFLFGRLMDAALGNVVYDETARLYLGADYPDCSDMSTELWLIDQADEMKLESDDQQEPLGAEETFEDLTRYRLEARLIIQRIQELKAQNFMVYDAKAKTRRPFQYRDIVILVRAMTGVPEMMEEMRKAGIGVYGEISKGYFDAIEVQVMLSLLKIIDNPLQDIPFAAVLRSPMVHLSEEVMTEIRLTHHSDSFYQACEAFVKAPSLRVDTTSVQRLSGFLTKLDQFRRYAVQMELPELIHLLFEETGYFDFVGGLPGGKQRQANLQALYDRAKRFNQTSMQGLFRFLHFIDRMKKRGEDMGEARALGEQENVVRIMSIHKSKGLEFPIVFLCQLSKGFNLRDLYGTYVLSRQAGIGLAYRNGIERIEYETFLQMGIKEELRLEQLSEELRVLYVALTRPKEKLILIGTVKNLEKEKEKWQMAETSLNDFGVLPIYMRGEATSYLDWIMSALYGKIPLVNGAVWRTDDIHLTIYLPKSCTLQWKEEKLAQDSSEIFMQIQARRPLNDVWVSEEIEKRLQFVYPYQALTQIASHTSATEMKRKQLENEKEQYQTVTGFQQSFSIGTNERFAPPVFLKKKILTAAQIGTATHFVLQSLNLKDDLTKKGIARQIHQMLQKEMLTKEEAEAVQVDQLVHFFKSPMGQSLCQSSKIYRELPFIFGIPIEELYPHIQHENEKLYVKGIIDCLFETETGWIILDFKTDRLGGKSFDEMRSVFQKRYAKQMEIYTRATKEIMKSSVIGRYVYFLEAKEVLKF